MSVSHYLLPNEVTQWWLSLWPADECPCICSITNRESVAPFLGKITRGAQRVCHHPVVVGPPQRVGGANATDSLFNSCVKRRTVFSLSASVGRTMAEQTKKILMTTDDETSKTSADPKKKKWRSSTFRWRHTVKKAKRQSARKISLFLGLVGTTNIHKYIIYST